MPPGTVWIPDRTGYQSMVGTTPMRVVFPMFASLGGGAPVVADGRTHCLTMELKEPEQGVRYFPYMSSDPVLEGLSELTNASRRRGPWDQVRTWIYTDKIGLDDANKRIAPPVTEAQYLNGLYDVFRLGGLRTSDVKNAEIFSPSLLAGAYSDGKSFAWFSLLMCESNGKAVKAWLDGSPDELRNLVIVPTDEYQTRHAPRLFNTLLNSINDDVRVEALSYLERTKGGEAALKGKIGDFSMSLYSDDAKEAALAEKVALRYR